MARATLANLLRMPGGLTLVNHAHRRLTLAQKRRFFYLASELSPRVDGTWRVDFGGRRLALALHREFEWAWLAATAFHGYDTEVHELYETLVLGPRPPRVFFDVGANHGLHSLKLLAHGVRVVSFEPNPACRTFFVECCQRNGLRPDLRPVSVGARPGRAVLGIPDRRTWLGTTTSKVMAGWGREVEVETLDVRQVTLDGEVASDGLIPDVIKIDTEGSELAVLQGATAILETVRPLIVLESWAVVPQRSRLFALLAALGYTMHALRFARPPSTPLTRTEFTSSSATNFVARPRLPRRWSPE